MIVLGGFSAASSHDGAAPPDEPLWPWFVRFLNHEVKPYPGRLLLVTRYVLAACLTMLCIMVFRLPGGAIGGFFTLLLPRSSPRTTALAGINGVLGFAAGELFLIAGAELCVNYPLLHVAWVGAGLFLAFWALSALANPSAAQAFAIVLAVGLPGWDIHMPVHGIVRTDLWSAGTPVIGIVMTILIEYMFHPAASRDEVERGLLDRLETVAQVLDAQSSEDTRAQANKRLDGFALAGVSSLREELPKRSLKSHELHRLGAVVSFTGRLVDLASQLPKCSNISADEEGALQIAERIRQLRFSASDGAHKPARLVQPMHITPGTLLGDIAQMVEQLGASVKAVPPLLYPGESTPPPAKRFFKPDALTSVAHVIFGFRGGMAAFVCYLTFTLVAYPGLAPSIFTCVVTATPSIGASRQKQFLRICGSLTGGVLLGIGSQVFILPMLDTFGGFLILFAVVTAASAWVLTGSPRISYYGAQIGLGSYTVQLHGFGPQLDLALARDGVVGILLGLVMMWLFFEKVGGKSALAVMQSLLQDSLRDLATLASLPRTAREADVTLARTLRGRIVTSLSGIGAQADAVYFEGGEGRERSLQRQQQLISAEAVVQATLASMMAILQFRLLHQTESMTEELFAVQRTADSKLSALLLALSQPHVVDRAYLEDEVAAVEASLVNVRSLLASDKQPTDVETDLSLQHQLTLHIQSLVGVLQPKPEIGMILQGEVRESS